jgi:hypothetical protein
MQPRERASRFRPVLVGPEQCGRFCEASLQDAQVGQLGDRPDAQQVTARRTWRHGFHQRCLGSIPPSDALEEAPVCHSTVGLEDAWRTTVRREPPKKYVVSIR